MTTKEKNADIKHDGHRERLLDLITEAGITKMSNIQIVEWALTMIFPRGNVNPLAHRLLVKYKNFANIVDASVEDLCDVDGINRKSAKKIKSFKQIMFAYNLSKIEKRFSLNNKDEFLIHIENLLRFEPSEFLILFALNARNEITQYRIFEMDSIRATGVPPTALIGFVSSTKMARMIAAHNHPGGYAKQSDDDEDSNKMINRLLTTLGVSLFDSYIVSDDGIYSSNIDGYIKYFDENLILLK